MEKILFWMSIALGAIIIGTLVYVVIKKRRETIKTREQQDRVRKLVHYVESNFGPAYSLFQRDVSKFSPERAERAEFLLNQLEQRVEAKGQRAARHLYLIFADEANEVTLIESEEHLGDGMENVLAHFWRASAMVSC
jgi:hypothetical protein